MVEFFHQIFSPIKNKSASIASFQSWSKESFLILEQQKVFSSPNLNSHKAASSKTSIGMSNQPKNGAHFIYWFHWNVFYFWVLKHFKGPMFHFKFKFGILYSPLQYGAQPRAKMDRGLGIPL